LAATIDAGQAALGGVSFGVPQLSRLGRREVTLGIRASEVELAADGLPAVVALCEVLGEEMIVDLEIGGVSLRSKSPVRQRIREGTRVHVRIDPARLHVFDAATG